MGATTVAFHPARIATLLELARLVTERTEAQQYATERIRINQHNNPDQIRVRDVRTVVKMVLGSNIELTTNEREALWGLDCLSVDAQFGSKLT